MIIKQNKINNWRFRIFRPRSGLQFECGPLPSLCTRLLIRRLWPCKREGVTRTWVKTKLANYMLLDDVGRSLLRMGSAEECALFGTLYMRVRLRVCWKRCLRRLKKREKRYVPVSYGRKPSGKTTLQWTLPVSETVLRGLLYGLCTGLLSYVSRKEVCGIDSCEYSNVLRVRVCPTSSRK